MGLPFNTCAVATTVTYLVSRYDSNNLRSCCTSPVPTNPDEPHSSVPDSELDFGGTEEVKPQVSLLTS